MAIFQIIVSIFFIMLIGAIIVNILFAAVLASIYFAVGLGISLITAIIWAIIRMVNRRQ